MKKIKFISVSLMIIPVFLFKLSAQLDGPNYDIGINVGGMMDYAPSKPFADAMRQHRYWTRIGGNNGECNLDQNYWPTEDATCLLYHGLSTGNNHGTYALSYDGQPVDVSSNTGSISNVQYDGTTNRTTANLTITDQGNSQLFLTFTNTNNGVRNVKLMRPLTPGGSEPHPDSQIFYQGFLDALTTFSILRTMDFTSTNASDEKNWADRTLWTHATQNPPEPAGKDYGWQGRPASWESVIMLANESQKDVWICLPHKATDNYIQKVAELFRDGNEHTDPLDPNLNLYVEYSNEVWNWAPAFTQTHYARDRGTSYGHPITFDGTPGNDNIALRRFYAMRTVQISKIFRNVFGDTQMMDRIRPVMMSQKGFEDMAAYAFNFIDRYYGGADPNSDYSDPKPVNYFIYGFSGTTYFKPNSGVTIDNIWNSNEFDGWGKQIDKVGAMSVWAKTFGLKTMAYEGNVHYTYDGQGTDDVIDQAYEDPRWTEELQEQFEVFANVGGDHWSYFSLEGWFPPTGDDIFNTSHRVYQKLVDLSNSPRHEVTYGNTAPFSIDGKAYHEFTVGWREPGTGSMDLTGGTNDYAASYAFHVNAAGTYEIQIDYNSTQNATLQLMIKGDEIYNQNLSSTGGSTTSTNKTEAYLMPDNLYVLRVACLDGEIQIDKVHVTEGTIGPEDTTPPSVPDGLSTSDIMDNSMTLSWNASNDSESGVASYNIFVDSILYANVTSTNTTINDLSPGVTYQLNVSAIDNADNESDLSLPLSETTTGTPDTTPPDIPGGLTSTNATSNSVSLSWDASNDNVGVTGYEVFVDGLVSKTVTTTNATITGLNPDITYQFKVRAKDAAGNLSGFSQTINVTTDAIPSDAQIKSTSASITINGLIENAWDNANPYQINNVIKGSVSDNSDLSGTWKGLWDNTNLYLLVEVTDDNVKESDSPGAPWEDDAVEIFVDADNSKNAGSYDNNDYQLDFIYGISSIATGDNSSTANIDQMDFAIADVTGGYVCEILIPWAAMGVSGSVSHNYFIGLDIQINDDDLGSTTRDGKKAWFALQDNLWEDPSLFADAKLIDVSVGTDPVNIVDQNITVYPNPVFSGLVKLNQTADIEIFTATGISVKSKKHVNQIDVSNLNKGIYIMNISIDEYTKQIKLVIE